MLNLSYDELTKFINGMRESGKVITSDDFKSFVDSLNNRLKEEVGSDDNDK